MTGLLTRSDYNESDKEEKPGRVVIKGAIFMNREESPLGRI
jgi:hypothetical protein